MAQGINHGADETGLIHRYFNDIADSTPLSREREVELSARIAEGDMAARDELVEANLRFVVDVAKNYQNRGFPISELISAGNLGLMTAAERFDGSRGFKFISYAVWWIRQAILQTLAEQSRTVRLPWNKIALLKDIAKVHRRLGQDVDDSVLLDEASRELDVSVEEVRQTILDGRSMRSLDAEFSSQDERSLLEVLHDTGPAPDANLYESASIEALNRLISALDERERYIMRAYYGLDTPETKTLEEIGEEIGLTRERVRQLKEYALTKLHNSGRIARVLGIEHRAALPAEAFIQSAEQSWEKLTACAKARLLENEAKAKAAAAKARTKGAGLASANGSGNGAAQKESHATPARRWTPEQIAARNVKEAPERAKRTKTNGSRAVAWVYDQDTDTAILAAIDRLAKQLKRAPTPYEVMWELHGQIPEEGIEKVALAADARERIAV